MARTARVIHSSSPQRATEQSSATGACSSLLVFNRVLGPALMFAVAWLLLADLPDCHTGLVIVGLARCIAVVIIWNDLARGTENAAVLVALNSVFQVIALAGLGSLYLGVLPGWLGLPQAGLDVSGQASPVTR